MYPHFFLLMGVRVGSFLKSASRLCILGMAHSEWQGDVGDDDDDDEDKDGDEDDDNDEDDEDDEDERDDTDEGDERD